MPIEILMPALSPTMEEGTLTKWLVAEGDEVNSGDVLAEIETDKATMEIEAVEEGVVAAILVAEGTAGVKVNAPIAVLLEDGEDKSAMDGYVAGAASALWLPRPPVAAPHGGTSPAKRVEEYRANNTGTSCSSTRKCGGGGTPLDQAAARSPGTQACYGKPRPAYKGITSSQDA